MASSKKPHHARATKQPRSQESPTGKAVSEDDQFYLDWGRDSLRNNLVFLNDVLRQLVTLTSTLLGGTVVFLDDKIIDPSYKIFIIIAFFLGLVVSFLGMLPHTRQVDLRSPSDIKQHKLWSTRFKRRFVMAAGVFVLIGFGTTGAGMIAKANSNTHASITGAIQVSPSKSHD